jgi:hypothetical protein
MLLRYSINASRNDDNVAGELLLLMKRYGAKVAELLGLCCVAFGPTSEDWPGMCQLGKTKKHPCRGWLGCVWGVFISSKMLILGWGWVKVFLVT